MISLERRMRILNNIGTFEEYKVSIRWFRSFLSLMLKFYTYD